MSIARHRALALLAKCRGDEIWSLEHCRDSGVPELWIEELKDTFESGFQSDRQTIYVENQVTNHYHGVRDFDLAIQIARSMGLDADRLAVARLGQRGVVQAIKEAVMDGE